LLSISSLQLALPCSFERTDLEAMDRVLKSYNIQTRYDTIVVPKPSVPQALDAKATERKFNAVISVLESDMDKRNVDKPLMLGRMFAAAMNQQSGLKKLYKSTLTEDLIQEITVSIDGLARPVTWWGETTTAVAHDEWIEMSAKNVAEVLIPMTEAWNAGARLRIRTKGHAISVESNIRLEVQ
jgi:hypothetical protein